MRVRDNNIPRELRERPQWVCWKPRSKKDGKIDKIPVNSATGGNASHSNPKTWGTFKQAFARYQAGKNTLAGIGYVFSKDDSYCGIDLDGCRDPKTGEVEPWASEIIQKLSSYTELSQSGVGIHIIAIGSLSGGGKKNERIEMYDRLRFFCVTGQHLKGTPKQILDAQEAVTELYKKHFKKEPAPESAPQRAPSPVSLDDADLIRKALDSKNGGKFDLLSRGQWEAAGYPSQSEADQAFCAMLAFWTGRDAERIDRLFGQTGLMRQKWDKKHHADGSTYGQKTIERAIANCAEVYGAKTQQKDPEKVSHTEEKGWPAVQKDGKAPGDDPFDFDNIILEAEEFLKAPIPQRQSILKPWVKEQSIILVPGWRGVGKTWFCMSICDAITTGKSLGPWEVETTCPCLYVEADMAGADVQERVRELLHPTRREQPLYVYSDAWANLQGKPRASLLDKKWRDSIKKYMLEREIKLWVTDNIASLAPGIDENAKKDWDPINQWLLELRFLGITTILPHHTNKEGGQRGTSGREDNIDISVKLVRPHDYVPEDGCRFVAKFEKARIATKDLPLIGDTEFKLCQEENGPCGWTYKNVRKQKRKEVLSGLDAGKNQKDIAEELEITKGYVSQIKNQAIKDGLLSKTGKLTQTGFLYVQD